MSASEPETCPTCGLHPYDFDVTEYEREVKRLEEQLEAAQRDARDFYNASCVYEDQIKELKEQLEVAGRREEYEQKRAEKWHGKYVALVEQLEVVTRERDDYRFWNERVRTCEAHTQDVAAPMGDCLICNHDSLLEQLEALRAALAKVLDWEQYDPEYADDVTQREHEAEYAAARTLLASNPASSPRCTCRRYRQDTDPLCEVHAPASSRLGTDPDQGFQLLPDAHQEPSPAKRPA